MRPSTELGSWRTWLGDGRVRIGVSACLLGREVRFNGGHCRSRFLTDELEPWVEWVETCPEMELGLGTPRPTLRLVLEDGEERLRTSTGDADHTDGMREQSRRRAPELLALGLDGFILKKDSPSCGLERVKVYAKSSAQRTGRGLFAAALHDLDPTLPLEEEGRLNDPHLRERFVLRVFARQRWRALRERDVSRADLVAFHTAHKLLLQACDDAAYRELGPIVASFGTRPDSEVVEAYDRVFRRALVGHGSRGRHVNVMMHLLGHLKAALEPTMKRRLLQSFEAYRNGLHPIAVPLALLRFLFEQHDLDYPRGQLFLDPYPEELLLRNAV